jgi:hypothetical protein
MKRIIKTGAATAIAALAALGVIGTATGASANVAVTNGVGSVGKGDVQTALGYANDAAFQADAQAGKITFSNGSDTTTLTWHPNCGVYVNGVSSPDTFRPVDIDGGTVTTTRTPNVTVLKNSAGKVTGYTLNGDTDVTTGSLNWSAWATGCPAGTGFAGWVDAAHAFDYVSTPGGTDLHVSNGTKTVALPNTPV